MFQRWNLQLRWRYGLLDEKHLNRSPTSPPLILLLIRKGRSGDGSYSESRIISNPAEVVRALKGIGEVEVRDIDLSDYSFDEQMLLISKTSIIVGMHGAGITVRYYIIILYFIVNHADTTLNVLISYLRSIRCIWPSVLHYAAAK